MALIKNNSIDAVNEADIVEVITRLLPDGLKRAGANYKAKSPFIDERSDSFLVSPAKNIWKCFSTGNGGIGPVSFVMKLKNKSWIEAIIEVAEIAKIIIEYEDVNDEKKEEIAQKELEKTLLERTKNKFVQYFHELDDAHWAKSNIMKREYNQETISQFQIGYSTPNSNDLTAPLMEAGKINEGLKIGICAKKENRTFDFFNDRLMFPILDDRGRTIGFGGRASAEAIEKKQPKYLNTPETGHYDKSNVLFGFFQARQSIVKNYKVYLTEGYTDVMGFFDKNVTNTVATCGTSLSESHVKKLRKLCPEIILVRDGDTAGRKAAFRDIDIILSAGMKVSLVSLPEGFDPDDISKQYKQGLLTFLESNTTDALAYKAQVLKNEARNPDEVAIAVSEVCHTLLKISDTIKRKEYAKLCAKKMKVSLKEFTDKLDFLISLEKEKKAPLNNIDLEEKENLMIIGFPEDGDLVQFKKDGYVIAQKQKAIYFHVNNEKSEYFIKGTNFICTPLFSIRSGKGTGKRMLEFENNVGEKTVFNLDNKEINNFSLFKEVIVNGFNFTFDGKTTNYHYTQFKNKLLYNFKNAEELTTLGSQPEGFFAFANGIIFQNNFFNVDDYGMINVNIEADESENQKEINKLFYIPAFSKANIQSREDDDPYEGIREFVYKPSEINFSQWMNLMVEVYGKDKAMVGIGFYIASIFRSIIVNSFGSFPFLFLTGSKQSGKTTFSESLTYMFSPGQKGFDLNSGSNVGFSRRVSRIRDIIISLEEYHDQIHEVKFQTLKGAFDNRGRETGQATNDNKTNVTKVKSACIILSQYQTTRDDNSLASRCITMNFLERNYSEKEKATFFRLKELQEKGMTSIVAEILKYKKYFESEFNKSIAIINSEIVKEVKASGSEYMERMLQNYTVILTPVKILYNKYNWPFTFEEFKKMCIEQIISGSENIADTEGVSTFWRTLEFLVDNRRIKEKQDFKIEPKAEFSYYIKKNETQTFQNKNGDKILFLRLANVHQHYVETISRRKNEEPIGESTLKGYFKSKSYYIGAIKSLHFENGNSSCYAFNYTAMENMGVLNIIREFSQVSDIQQENELDLPF